MHLFVTKARLKRLVDIAIVTRADEASRETAEKKAEREKKEAHDEAVRKTFEALKPYVPGKPCRICGALVLIPKFVDGTRELRINGRVSIPSSPEPVYGCWDDGGRLPRCFLAVVCTACGGIDHRAGVEFATKKRSKQKSKKKAAKKRAKKKAKKKSRGARSA